MYLPKQVIQILISLLEIKYLKNEDGLVKIFFIITGFLAIGFFHAFRPVVFKLFLIMAHCALHKIPNNSLTIDIFKIIFVFVI